MVKTVAILAFIGAAGAGAAALAMRKTVISGKVMEADLLAQVRKSGYTQVSCDPEIPVGTDGATFVCRFTRPDHDPEDVEIKLDRGLKYTSREIKNRPATDTTPERVPPSGDPWNN